MKLNPKTQADVKPLLFTIEEAARALRCSRSTIYNLMDTGAVKSVKIGHLRRIRPEAIDTFLKSCG